MGVTILMAALSLSTVELYVRIVHEHEEELFVI
jgi:hypothetical protein